MEIKDNASLDNSTEQNRDDSDLLTSSAGKMTMGVINHVAQFECDLLIEHTHSGLTKAKANGKKLGRPNCTPLSLDFLTAR